MKIKKQVFSLAVVLILAGMSTRAWTQGVQAVVESPSGVNIVLAPGQETHGGDMVVEEFMYYVLNAGLSIAQLIPSELPTPHFSQEFFNKIFSFEPRSKQTVSETLDGNSIDRDAVYDDSTSPPKLWVSRKNWLEYAQDPEKKLWAAVYEMHRVMGLDSIRRESTQKIVNAIRRNEGARFSESFGMPWADRMHDCGLLVGVEAAVRSHVTPVPGIWDLDSAPDVHYWHAAFERLRDEVYELRIKIMLAAQSIYSQYFKISLQSVSGSILILEHKKSGDAADWFNLTKNYDEQLKRLPKQIKVLKKLACGMDPRSVQKALYLLDRLSTHSELDKAVYKEVRAGLFKIPESAFNNYPREGSIYEKRRYLQMQVFKSNDVTAVNNFIFHLESEDDMSPIYQWD